MRPARLFSVLLGVPCAVACLVPSFDVGPIADASGGSSSGETSSGGKTVIPAGGKASGGASAGSGPLTGGAGASAGKSGGGGSPQPQAGTGGAAGESNEGGAGGETGEWTGPVQIGFSEFHDSAAGSDDASSHLPDATFTKPAGTQTGDFMLVFFGADHSLQNMNTQRLQLLGWTLEDQEHDYGTDGQATYLAYKFAGSTEPDSIVFPDINPDGPGNGVQGLLSVYRGVNLTAPVNDYQTVIVDTGFDGATHIETDTPEVNTTVANCLLVAGLSPDSAVDAPKVSAWPDGFDQDQVSVINPLHPYPYGWANIYSASRRQPRAGTVTASKFGWDLTYGGKKYDGALTFVLALAPR